MLVGMLTGIAALFWIWMSGALAWTWYAFAGAAITSVVALVTSRALDRA